MSTCLELLFLAFTCFYSVGLRMCGPLIKGYIIGSTKKAAYELVEHASNTRLVLRAYMYTWTVNSKNGFGPGLKQRKPDVPFSSSS